MFLARRLAPVDGFGREYVAVIRSANPLSVYDMQEEVGDTYRQNPWPYGAAPAEGRIADLSFVAGDEAVASLQPVTVNP